MNQQTKLSVIVPVYKVEKYLDKCVRSLMNQSLKEIEIILVDDESPDGCPQMCENYAKQDSRVKVIHKKNGGLGFARNSGMEIAKGEYIAFVDSDDYVDLDTYKFLFSKYSDYDLDVIYYNFVRFINTEEKESQRIDTLNIIEGNQIKEFMLDIITAAPSIKTEKILRCSSCTAIYRRSIIESHGISFHSERELVSEDLIFNLDFLSKASRISMDQSVLYFYRVNDQSLSHSFNIQKNDRIATFSNYLRNSYHLWNLPAKEFNERVSRWTVGNFRIFLTMMLVSKASRDEKKKYFISVVNMPILKNALAEYPWKEYSTYHKLYYWALRYKLFNLAKALSYIKNINSKLY